MSTETPSRATASGERVKASKRAATIAALLLGSVLGVAPGGCGTPQVATPSRSLDRPSDAALFCVDYELDSDGNHCLPQLGDPDRDPESYLNTWCNDSSWRDLTPRATVLALNECDESHRRVRTEAYFAKVRSAARALGRDPDYPCCPPENPGCSTATPACLRRELSMVIANTARGELAVANTGAVTPGLSTIGRLQNLHSAQPGFGFLPTGLLPEHVRTFSPPEARLPDGRVASPSAWAVTANVGSCDVSMVQLQAVAELTRRADSCDDKDHACATSRCDARSCPQQWRPYFLDGTGQPKPLSSRPAWIEVAPWADANRRPVFIAYPTCGLIAVADLDPPAAGGPQPGRISEAIAFDQADPKKPPRVLSQTELAMLQCPADCGGDTAMLMPNPNTLPPGGAMRAASYPATLAVDGEGRRLLIGDQLGTALTVVNFDSEAAAGAHLIGPPRQVPLDFVSRNSTLRSGGRGIDVIRVTPRTEAGRFAYVMARDSTVRVIDLDQEVECETNPDPRFLMQNAGGKLRVLPEEQNESNLRRLSCIPVSPATPRRPLVATPGIVMPNGSVPADVGFMHLDTLPCISTDPTQCTYWPSAPQENWRRADGSVWIGDFGWILGGGGAILGIQIADSCPQPSYRACFADCGAQRRLALLHTRSQELAAPEQFQLPALFQARVLTPQDRLGNVRRNNSRFEDQGNLPAGPYVDSDGTGLPIYSAQIGGAFTALYSTVPGPANTNQTRRQLLYPTPAPYYYLPVDPVCDAAIGPQAVDLSSPDGVLPAEPTRRPVTIASFTDPLAATGELWGLTWEGRLSDQLARTSGRMLSTGRLIDVNGLYCSRGVETSDKVWLTGCQSNNDCPLGTLCRLEQLQGTAPGVCLTNDAATQCRRLSQQLMPDTSNDTEWATTWLRRYRISKAQQQVAVAGAGTDTVDALTLDEIAEPEFELERKSCKLADLGNKCEHYQAWVLPRHAPSTTPLVSREAYCRVTGLDPVGMPVTSCILQCTKNDECGDGFVCARSPYEKYEGGKSKVPGRCVRAPLITADTMTTQGTSLGTAGAAQLIAACFPDEVRYEVRGGDAFVVVGTLTGSPALEQRASDGTCVRPAPGDPDFAASRLLQPRLRLGPYESLGDTDPGRCPKAPTGWISHRIPHAAEASAAPSCQYVLNNGNRKDDGTEVFGCNPATTSPDGVTLPEGNTVPLGVVQGDGFLPRAPDPLTETVGPTRGRPRSYTPGATQCALGSTDPACRDPWIDREYELFSVLPLTTSTNQCVLTGTAEENNITKSYNNANPPNNDWNKDNPYTDAPEYDQKCTGFCRFPGDHTEVGGVRRIHYENAIGNLVMRVPRDPAHPTDPNPPTCKNPVSGNPPGCADPTTVAELVPPRWAVPPEGYLVSFRIVGGLAPYVMPAQTAHRDDSSGLLAQSLKVAIPAFDGIVYLLDEGRNGSPAGLRGQIMRVIGALVDPAFLLR